MQDSQRIFQPSLEYWPVIACAFPRARHEFQHELIQPAPVILAVGTARAVADRVVLAEGSRDDASRPMPSFWSCCRPLPEAVASRRARAGAAGWPDGSGRPFLLGHDRHRSRHASECLGARLCGGARARTRAKITRRSPRPIRRRRRSAGIVFDGDEGRFPRKLSCVILPATCRRRKQRCSTRSSSRSTRRCWPARPRRRPGDRSRAIMRSRRKTARSIRTSSASWPSGWAPRRSR